MNKTKVMISGERQKVGQKAIRWPCGVCSKGVGSNSLQCTSCQKWVHKKCSGIKGSMSKVVKSFICRGCLNPVTSAGRTSVDIGASAKLELVDKFYLGDMLSVVGDADAAVEARIRIGWNNRHVNQQIKHSDSTGALINSTGEPVTSDCQTADMFCWCNR